MIIQGDQLSIVVQGNVRPGTIEAGYHLRQMFPEAELIFSTGKHDLENAKTYPADQIVLHEDPGQTVLKHGYHTFTSHEYGYVWKIPPGTPVNTNRMIVSTVAGIKAATRPYVLKLRSDQVIHNPAFLALYGQFDDNREEAFKVFDSKVINTTMFAIDVMKWNKYPFHPSDHTTFATKEDSLKFWDAKLLPDLVYDYDPWFKDHIDARCIPEMYIGTQMFNQPYKLQLNKETTERSINYFAHNLIFTDATPSTVWSTKTDPGWLDHNSVLSTKTWLNNYTRDKIWI